MPIAYTKMHGAGNKILLVDRRHDNRPPPGIEQLRALADPATGPGFDQLMWIGPGPDAESAASYRVFNADGSEVEQCGNGVRCVALLLAGRDATPDGAPSLRLASPAGPVEARVLGPGRVTVNMGPPEFDPAKVPFDASRQARSYPVDIDGKRYELAVLSMGNPHAVLVVADIAAAPVATLGPLIEGHARFPERCNAGFMQLIDRRTVALRVYERGAGETLACGTGACAAVVAGQRMGRLDPEVTVRLPGGDLVVSWRGGTEPVWLTGDAEWISEGTIDL